MSDFKPGAVAVATVRGIPNVRVFRTAQVHDAHVYLWQTATVVGNSVGFQDEDVTDIRPLFVLDLVLGDAKPEHFVSILNDRSHPYTDHIADQIIEQTRPPRIPEPGLWGVVEAGVKQHDARLRWVRLGTNYRPDDAGEYDRLWTDLIDPVLIRDGIEDGAK